MNVLLDTRETSLGNAYNRLFRRSVPHASFVVPINKHVQVITIFIVQFITLDRFARIPKKVVDKFT